MVGVGGVSRLCAPFYGLDALHLRGRRLEGETQSQYWSRVLQRRELTWGISNDGVEERTTSPGISRDVEGTQVQDAMSHAILSGGTHDPRWSVLGVSSAHLSAINI